MCTNIFYNTLSLPWELWTARDDKYQHCEPWSHTKFVRPRAFGSAIWKMAEGLRVVEEDKLRHDSQTPSDSKIKRRGHRPLVTSIEHEHS